MEPVVLVEPDVAGTFPELLFGVLTFNDAIDALVLLVLVDA